MRISLKVNEAKALGFAVKTGTTDYDDSLSFLVPMFPQSDTYKDRETGATEKRANPGIAAAGSAQWVGKDPYPLLGSQIRAWAVVKPHRVAGSGVKASERKAL